MGALHKHAKTFLRNFKGYLQTDMYSGYSWLDDTESITQLGCLAHARRKFAEVVKLSKKKTGLAHQAIEMIGELYQLEKEIKDKSIEEKYKARQHHAKPQLTEIKTWLLEHINKAPPKGKLGQAMHYMLNHFDKLKRYIDDGRLDIDNNKIENAIRPFALGKKNWLFAGNPRGAKAGAILYSLLITAKENNLDQHAYLTFVFERIRDCKSEHDYRKLIPEYLAARQREGLRLKI